MPTNLFQLIQTLESQKSKQAQIASDIADTLQKVGDLLGALIGQRSSAVPAAPTAKSGPAAAKSAAKPAAKRRVRKQFALSGDESVIAFVRQHGNPTTQEISRHWKSEGRGGSVNNNLSQLVKAKKLKREPMKDGRGSRYKIA